jgi:histidinol-phosphate aminotransferase
MAPYSPPTGGRAEKLRLDFNENTVGCSPRVIEFLSKRLTASQLSIYPEYTDAIRDLAAFFGVSADEFTLTNGTDEAIQLLVNTYVDDGDDVVLLKPSYAMYRFYAEVAGASIRELEYRRDDLSFPLEELLAALRPETRAVLIANPNNPTGTGIGQEGLRKILEAAPGAAVLIDEAYYEFSGVTALGWLREFTNLFVSRTFSKVYGMAAMRCGCLFSRAENVQWLRKAQSPYSVNMLAAIAARASRITSRKCWRRAHSPTKDFESSGSSASRARPTSFCFRRGSGRFRFAMRCASAACWCGTAAMRSPAASASPSAHARRPGGFSKNWSACGPADRFRHGRRAHGGLGILSRGHRADGGAFHRPADHARFDPGLQESGRLE